MTENQERRANHIIDFYKETRQYSHALCEGLSAEDMQVQSMADASPTKWHLAHTTWFFETFILEKFSKNYTVFNNHFAFLFNSYYDSQGERHARPQRGLLTRPGIETIFNYRQHVDEHMLRLVADSEQSYPEILDLIEIGCHHEMQHQELILTDILHAFAQNSAHPCLIPTPPKYQDQQAPQLHFVTFEGGLYEIGAQSNDGNFAYDCERPTHKAYLHDFSLANRCVTNREWINFIEDGAYQQPLLWLSDGWHCKQKNNWLAPAYWQKIDEQWFQFGSNGLQPVQLDAPVCHVSYYEADAFARWTGARLPTEQEWEVASQAQGIDPDRNNNNFSEQHLWQPRPSAKIPPNKLGDMFGNVWEWTQSAFAPYPGFKAEQGALGEYNGKFMANQFVLRGGSCTTPIKQMRNTYRNFFYPYHRWQFSGLRLAK